jgi:hypothetical protein
MIFLLATDPHGLTLTFWPSDYGRPKNVNHARRVINSIYLVSYFHSINQQYSRLQTSQPLSIYLPNLEPLNLLFFLLFVYVCVRLWLIIF